MISGLHVLKTLKNGCNKTKKTQIIWILDNLRHIYQLKAWCLKTRKLHKITNCCSILDITILHYWYLTGAKWILVLYTVISLLRVIIMITCRLIRLFKNSFHTVSILVCFLNIKKSRMKLWSIFLFSTVKPHTVNMVGTCYEHFPILNDVHVLDSLNLITFTDIKDIQRLWIINMIIKIINIFTIT